MRILFFLFLLIISAFSLTLDESKHLLNRTSFGYTKDDLIKFQKFSKKQAVDYLLTQAKSKDIYKQPSSIKEDSIFNGKFKTLSKEEKRALRKKRNKKFKK